MGWSRVKYQLVNEAASIPATESDASEKYDCVWKPVDSCRKPYANGCFGGI